MGRGVFLNIAHVIHCFAFGDHIVDGLLVKLGMPVFDIPTAGKGL
jgi:hypothetical protein